MGVWINKMWFIHAMKYPSAVKRDDTQNIHYLTDIILENKVKYKKTLIV